MLKELRINNLALVNRVTVRFEPGFNVLTGETGSGKSIIVDALGLVLGGRFSPELIRSGERNAFVEALFQLSDRMEVRRLCAENGLEVEPGEFVVRREITENGRSRVFVNDQLSNVNFLKLLRPYLVDIHGQGDQQGLLNPSAHRSMLDLFAGLDGLVGRVRDAFLAWREARDRLSDLISGESERLRNLDVLAFQCREIEAAQISDPEEDAVLEAERHRLVHAERLVGLALGCYQEIYESEDALTTRLSSVSRRVQELVSIDPHVADMVDSIENVRYALEDVAYFLRDYSESVTFSPERLMQVEQRLGDLQKLKRKYGPTLAEAARRGEALRAQLGSLQAAEADVRGLESELLGLEAAYRQAAGELSVRRGRAARELERAVSGELANLAMEGTRVRIDVRAGSPDSPDAWTAAGIDQVEYLISPNVGEELRGLAKIASGGEISRFMLALKTITAPADFPRTLVFDEVDVGIGGRVAEAVGQRLRKLGSHQQVLCVTHLAQIARFAGSHFLIRKKVVGERTETIVERLTRGKRVEELARMIGGASVTETTRRTADEMLEAV